MFLFQIATPPTSAATPQPMKRKGRASFRTKKGISRKPIIKKEISSNPASSQIPVPVQENKASRLRAQKLAAEQSEKQRARSSNSESRDSRGKRAGTRIPTPDRTMSESVHDRGKSAPLPPNFNPSYEPSPELQFVPLDSAYLPLDYDKSPIDQLKRKRRIERPVSNIFERAPHDIQEKGIRRYIPSEEQTEFVVHNVPPPPKPSASNPIRRTLPPVIKKAEICKNTKPDSLSIRGCTSAAGKPLDLSTRSRKLDSPTASPKSKKLESPTASPKSKMLDSPTASPKSKKLDSPTALKPRQLQEVQGSLVRRNSLDNSRRIKKGSPVPRLASYHSESSDQSMSYDSDNSPLPASPRLHDSVLNFSIEELERQRSNLRTPRRKTGSIRAKGVRSRRSWIISDQPLEDQGDEVSCSCR